MTVCRFYQKGHCRYGKDCKFEHVGPTTSSKPTTTKPNDKADTRPIWPLSAVALADNHQSGNAFGGDISPEELRLIAYSTAPRGQGTTVSNNERELVANHRLKIDGPSHPLQNGHQPIPNDPFKQSTFTNDNTNTAVMDFSNNSLPNNPSSTNQFNVPPVNNFNFGPSTHPSQNDAFQPATAPPQNNAFQPLTAPSQNNAFQPSSLPSQNNAFQPSNAAQPPNPNNDQLFTSNQFTFGSVPETAPVPQYY